MKSPTVRKAPRNKLVYEIVEGDLVLARVPARYVTREKAEATAELMAEAGNMLETLQWIRYYPGTPDKVKQRILEVTAFTQQ